MRHLRGAREGRAGHTPGATSHGPLSPDPGAAAGALYAHGGGKTSGAMPGRGPNAAAGCQQGFIARGPLGDAAVTGPGDTGLGPVLNQHYVSAARAQHTLGDQRAHLLAPATARFITTPTVESVVVGAA